MKRTESPIFVRPHNRECMKADKIEPGLRLETGSEDCHSSLTVHIMHITLILSMVIVHDLILQCLARYLHCSKCF